MTRRCKHACLLMQAPNLKLAITAGIGSDHVDLNAACEFGLTVAEITGASNASRQNAGIIAHDNLPAVLLGYLR